MKSWSSDRRRLADEFASLDRDLAPRNRQVSVVDEPLNVLQVRIGQAVWDDSGEGVYRSRVESFRDRNASAVTLLTVPTLPEEDLCGPLSCAPPMRGGVEIDSGTNPPDACSTGFNAQDNLGTQFVLTAGHCPAGSYTHSGFSVGPTTAPVVNSGNVDAQKIRYTLPYEWSPQNWVIARDTNGSTYYNEALTITSTIPTNAIAIGTVVCRSGFRTGDCGAITSTYALFNGSVGKIQMQACAFMGDSGGPVVDTANHVAYGLHSASSEQTEPCGAFELSFFSPIRDAEAAVGAYTLIRHGGISRPALKRGFSYLMRQTFTSGAQDFSFSFGETGDIPLFCDWDNDGDQTIGIFRPAQAWWYLRNSNTTGTPDIGPFQFGNPGDVPVCGDWNGDGRETVGVRRGNTFHIRNLNSSGIAIASFGFGNPTGDTPVVGDWDGNGTDTIGVVRATPAFQANWFLRDSNSTGASDYVFSFGAGQSITPFSQNCDNDKEDEVGYKVGDQWHIRADATGAGYMCTSFAYGLGTDTGRSFK